MNNSFDINVLVNGNRCKFYHHDGKTFIEAKHGSEYELEIKNNTWRRVLCLSSVDGLSVLNGTPATDSDPGYVIPAYSPLRIKGFRYSNDEVAAFKFTTKGNSYAHNTGGCEAARNCGVIGFKIWSEYVKPLPQWNITWSTSTPIGGPYWGDGGIYGRGLDSTISCFNNTLDMTDDPQPCCGGGGTYSAAAPMNNNLKGISSKSMKGSSAGGCSAGSQVLRAANFDMGSTWGQKIESKVIETDFEKGVLSFTLDIYYASRQSLIDMGVPVNVGNQVSFPQSFPNKYATPPSGWRG
jgi:hypothetical protein